VKLAESDLRDAGTKRPTPPHRLDQPVAALSRPFAATQIVRVRHRMVDIWAEDERLERIAGSVLPPAAALRQQFGHGDPAGREGERSDDVAPSQEVTER
jgi:hypothetical protein